MYTYNVKLKLLFFANCENIFPCSQAEFVEKERFLLQGFTFIITKLCLFTAQYLHSAPRYSSFFNLAKPFAHIIENKIGNCFNYFA